MSSLRSTAIVQSALPLAIGPYLLQQAVNPEAQTLDLSQFPSKIYVPLGGTSEDNDIVKALIALNLRHPNISTLDLSGHAEITNFEIEQFRQRLPRLTTIVVKNINPAHFCVSAPELLNCDYSGITFEADDSLQVSLNKRLLMAHEQNVGERTVNRKFRQLREVAECKGSPEFIESLSIPTTTYLAEVNGMKSIAERIDTLKLTADEAKAFEEYKDPVSKTYISIPVLLNGCYRDLDSLIVAKGYDAMTKRTFQPSAVTSGVDLYHKLKHDIAIVKDKRAAVAEAIYQLEKATTEKSVSYRR